MLWDFLLTLLLFLIVSAIVVLIIIIIRIGILTIRYRKWRKFSVPAVGVVGELKDVNCNHDKKGEISSYSYNYALKIIHDGQEFDDIYSEECIPGNIPTTRPGQKINILWLESERKYIKSDSFKKECQKTAKQTVMVAENILSRGLSRYLRR